MNKCLNKGLSQVYQGLGQDVESWSPKLAIGTILGVQGTIYYIQIPTIKVQFQILENF